MKGMGVTVREKIKGTGVYWIFVHHDNLRRSKKIGTRKAAEQIAKKIRARLVLGDMSLVENVKTFGHYADIWWLSVSITLKGKSVKAYKVCLFTHILPAFKDRDVKKITKLDVKTFLQGKIAQNQAKGSVDVMKSVLSGVFGFAMDAQEIVMNPALQLGKWAKRTTGKAEVTPLPYGELERLLTAFKVHYPNDYPIALTLARTGIRIGEVFALQWDDIDFNGRTIQIARTRDLMDVDTPKSNRSRVVDMSKELVKTLSDFRKYMKEKAFAKGWGSLPEWVFVDENGQLPSIYAWRYGIWRNALKKAKLRTYNVHDLRHTFASMLLMAGETPAYVQKQLGHRLLRTTLDVYGHYIPQDSTRRGVDVLDGVKEK